jgi:hypothetical protein
VPNQSISQELANEIRKRPTNRAITDEDFAAAAGQVLRECPRAYDGSNSSDVALRERVEIEWFGICPVSSWEARGKAITTDQPNKAPKTKGEGNCSKNARGEASLFSRQERSEKHQKTGNLARCSHIDERARAADHDPDFSRRIREGLPGM